jgi:hypothetical protein
MTNGSNAPRYPRARRIAVEAGGVFTAVGVGLILLRHLVAGDWRQYLYIDGDSVVLALLRESFDKGEPWQWVFSTQNFFFPEAPFYLLSSLLGGDPPVAYSINVVLNVVVLYVLLRLIGGELATGRRIPPALVVLVSTLVVLLYAGFVLTETVASPNRSGIATLYLLTTYYYGVTVGGLALLFLILRARRLLAPSELRAALRRPALLVTLAVIVLLVALVTFSNLLFLLEVLAPLLLTLVALVFMGRYAWREFGVLAGAIGIGVMAAFVLRQVFASVFRAGVGGYVAVDAIPTSVRNLILTVVETLDLPFGGVKLGVLVVLHTAATVVVLVALYAVARPRLAERIDDRTVLIAGFVFVSAASVLVGQVMTGATASRYLQVLYLFPLLVAMLAGLALAAWVARREALLGVVPRLALAAVAAAAALGVVVGAAIGIPSILSRISEPVADVSCLDDFVGDSNLNGVGTFWLARPYQVYGAQSGQVLQVSPDFTIQAWMVNLASYDQAEFSYVLLDSTGILPAETIEGELGEPAGIVDCGSFSIYDYRGTDGERILTERIRASLAELRAGY